MNYTLDKNERIMFTVIGSSTQIDWLENVSMYVNGKRPGEKKITKQTSEWL